jgi:hypothetical protein
VDKTYQYLENFTVQASRWAFGSFLLATFVFVTGCVSPAPRHAAHPAYLHSLSDLRAARWLIEHRPGDWAQTADEVDSVRQIDAAINDIKKAAIDDGKNLNDRPSTDAHYDNRGRIHEALRLLRQARADIAREEDNAYAGGLRNRAIGHIDAAIVSARNVFHE